MSAKESLKTKMFLENYLLKYVLPGEIFVFGPLQLLQSGCATL